MEPTQTDATPGDNTLEAVIQRRLGDLDSGRYRSTSESVLMDFASWARRESVTEPEGVNFQTVRQYCRYLKTRVELEDGTEGSISTSTAEQYFAIVRSFLSWCVREDLIQKNPAKLKDADEPLPDAPSDPQRQYWSDRDRKAICATADQLVDDTLDGEYSEHEKLTVFRNRALVYMLAYTGCRGAELTAVSSDSERNGLRWSNVDLHDGLVWVFGKSRETEETGIPSRALPAVERWRDVLKPEMGWPVFPTVHLPTLYGELPTDVSSCPETVWQDLREHECIPPSITVDGVRRLLERLCDQSQYEFDEMLKPHGARRGLGDKLYREQAELAQEFLRHDNIETTHEAYSERRTEKMTEQVDKILDE